MLEFPQGGIYFGVGSVIRLVLRPLSSVRVNKDVNIDLSGILRCHTYSQKPNNHEPIHRPPIYFSQTVRLVAAAGGSCKPQTSKCTDGQCAASEANRSYIAGNDFIIYCDQVPDVAVDYQTHSACFRALDSAPGKWKDLDNRIAHVVSYISKENVLLATSSCEKEYFLSTDSGDSWVSIDRPHFLHWNSHPETRPMVSVPWTIVPPGFQPSSTGSRCTTYQVRQWHCKFFL
uniref:Sortilin_C domain-containing protein n=1 Tax=Mesocestoides corti TaxID=53468 RepID=A0A5K3G5L5_MESCO